MKRKILSFILSLCFIFVSLPVMAETTEPPTDDDGVYLLDSTDDLCWFADQVDEGNANYKAKLMTNIDLQGDAENPWQPIGTPANFTGATLTDGVKYTGVFDGNGFTISGIYINADGNTFQGLFGYIGEGGVVKNLTVAGTVTAKANIGGIAGAIGKGTISNCVSCVEITGSGSYLGGIVGQITTATSDLYSIVENCANLGKLTGTATSGYIGGITGYNGTWNVIRLCRNAATITCDAATGYNSGGISGYCYMNANVQYCYNSGAIQGKTVGGIVGNLLTGAKMSNVYNVGTVVATAATGSKYGAIAGSSVPDLSAANCYTLAGLTTCSGTGTEYIKQSVVTVEELKGSTVLASLNGETTNFKQDYTPNINSGYPLLSWQTQVKHEVTFVGGDGAMGTAPENLKIAENNTFAIPDNPFAKTGYSFKGWSDGAKLYVSGEIYTLLDKDVILTAQWEINQYTIVFDSNGGTSVNDITQNYGTTVVAPAEPEKKGYRFDGWFSDAALNVPYAFTSMPAESIQLYAAWQDITTPKMTDVADNAWYYEDVFFVLANGIFKGTSAMTFSPEEGITRGQFITVLGRCEGVEDATKNNPAVNSEFSDIETTAYYASHVAWAAENHIVFGVKKGLFAPNERVTREQMVVMLYRYAIYKGIDLQEGNTIDLFADDAQISDFAKKAVYAMKAAGIISGIGRNNFDPQGESQRAEAAKVLAHLLKK